MNTKGHESDGKPAGLGPLVWWIIWFAILNGLIMAYLLLRPKTAPVPPPTEQWTDFLGLAPLLVSVALRWGVMPRITQRPRGFVLFILGVALAEGGGYFGIFLGHAHAKAVVTLALLGILQWAPVFARRFHEPPPSSLFHEPI